MNGSISHQTSRNRYANFDDILNKIGQFGRYQIFTCVVIQLSTIMWAGSKCFQYLAMVEPEIRCDYSRVQMNETDENIQQDFIKPTHPQYCQVFRNCSKDRLIIRNDVFYSPVQEWLLICDRAYVQYAMLAIYLVGRILGSFVGGHLGDCMGRQKGFFLAQFFILISSVMSIASQSWITLAICQCLNGFMFGVIIVTSYALTFEYTSNKYSLIANASFQYCLGYMVVAGVGAVTKHWRYYLIFVNLISAPLLVAYLLFLESPRYLIVKGKLHQAADVLTNLASDRWNNMNVEFWPDELTNVARDETNRVYTFVHLFSTRQLAGQTLLQVLSMFTCSIFTTTLFLNKAPVGTFYLFMYFGLFRLWIPLTMVLLDFHVPKCGRRHFYLWTLAVAGVCLTIALISLTAGVEASSPIVYVFLLTGIIVNASGYFMSVLHVTAVVYPTVVRCTAFGALQITEEVGTMLGRLGFEILSNRYWHGWPYFICLCCIIVNFVFAFVFQKETKNRRLVERIEDLKQE